MLNLLDDFEDSSSDAIFAVSSILRDLYSQAIA